MTQQRSFEIKVGLVSILAIVLLILGITFGRGYNVSVNQTLIKLRFPNSGGIQEGSPLVVNGVKRGSVTSVKNDEGSVLVTANIDETNDFRRDASARITILEITGGKKIEVNPGRSRQPFDIHNEIPGQTAFDIGDVVALVGDIGYDARGLVRRVDSITVQLNKILANRKLISQIESTVSNASDITSSLKSLIDNNASDIEASLNNLRVISSDLRSAIQKDAPKVDSLIDVLDRTLAQARNLIGNADSAINNANFMITDVRSMANDLKSNGSLASRLLYDKQLGLKLDSTLNDLYDFLITIKQHGVNVNLRLGTRP
jgi:phospholipid/cholesterol/gamma-HCH transport system substrate-binding protein